MKEKQVMTDEELVVLAQQGDEQATEILIVRHKSLVIKITRSYFLIGGDKEDLIQEGMIGLMGAVSNYNGKSSFTTFAGLCIKRRIDTVIKRAMCEKDKPLNNYVSLTNEDNVDCAGIIIDRLCINPETEYIYKEEEIEFQDKLRKGLSELEYTILALYLEGYSYVEIGLKIDKNAKSVDNALQRIRTKINTLI